MSIIYTENIREAMADQYLDCCLHLVCLAGEASFVLDDKTYRVKADDCIIKPGASPITEVWASGDFRMKGVYPTPAGVVGTLDKNEKLNWMLVGHVGIITHKLLSVSLHHTHLTTETAIKAKRLSLNLVNDAMLARADYVGIVSGKRTDKSGLFPWHKGEGGTPVIDEADLTMELEVIDDYEAEGFHNLICRISNTYINPDMLDEKGKIDYTKLKPILFEMPTYKYLRTGEVAGDCLKLGKEMKEQLASE